jgi:hypothetical protein
MPTMVFLVIFTMLYVKQQEYDNYYKTTCDIVNATYPANLTDHSGDTYWIPCSCGKRCRSVSACLRIYARENELYILASYDDKNAECTFREKPCLQNENPLVLIEQINRYAQMAEEYLNSTVTCYKNKDNPNSEPIYLELKDVSTALYIISGILGFFLLIMVYLVWDMCRKESQRHKNIKVSHTIVPIVESPVYFDRPN